jgi:hypothetical protein
MRTGEGGCTVMVMQQGPPQGGGTADGYGFGRSPMDCWHSQIVATRWDLSCSGDRIKPPQGGGTADGYGFGRSPMDCWHSQIVATRWDLSCSRDPHREAAQLMVMHLAVRRWIVGILK